MKIINFSENSKYSFSEEKASVKIIILDVSTGLLLGIPQKEV